MYRHVCMCMCMYIYIYIFEFEENLTHSCLLQTCFIALANHQINNESKTLEQQTSKHLSVPKTKIESFYFHFLR